jgi:N-acetylglucosaminyldiphosphoundecaprenol N-acetyl-beta-D-mannosaminyltransferase
MQTYPVLLSSAESSQSIESGKLERYQIVPIGPLRIHALNNTDLMTRLVGHMLFGSTKTYQVVTANAQFYNLAEQRADFRACVAEAEYVCADGISIVMACRWLANSIVARVPGVDLLDGLCGEAVKYDLPVYFLGGKPGSLEKSAAVLAEKYPGFVLAGQSCPTVNFENNEAELKAVLDDIERVNPSIIFVALGAPKQELFIHNHIRKLKVPVAIGVGGSFEIIAGVVPRAPAIMQKFGAEWLFRWSQEPSRLTKRYFIGNAVFLYYILRQAITKRRTVVGNPSNMSDEGNATSGLTHFSTLSPVTGFSKNDVRSEASSHSVPA